MSRIVLVVAVFAALVIVATAQQPGPDGSALGLDRDVIIDVEAGGVFLKSQTRDGANRNRFEVQYYGGDNQFRIEMRSFDSTATTAVGNKFQLQMQVVIEYMETDGVAGFTEADRTLHTYVIGQSGGPVWCETDANTTDPNDSADIVQHFHCNTADNVFLTRGYMASEQLTVGGVVVLPSGHKFDLVFTPNWNTTVGSRITFVTYVQSDSGTGVTAQGATAAQQAANLTTQVAFGDAALPFATFDWKPTVTINGAASNVADVITSNFDITYPSGPGSPAPPAGESQTRVAFSFDYVNPTSIEWDPVVAMGAGSVSSTTGSSSTTSGASPLSSTAAVVVAAVAALVAVVA